MSIKLFRIAMALSLVLGAGTALADHEPSPCAVGEIGEGNNCMYLTVAGATYDPISGNRSLSGAPGSYDVLVWMDFGTAAVQGGGFDITYDTSQVLAATWTISPVLQGDVTSPGAEGATGFEAIQFDDFAGNGYGGSTGTKPGFQLVGTLTVTVAGDVPVLFSIAQPYSTNTFPNCFAPGAASGLPLECVATNFFDLTIDSSPLSDSDGDGITDDQDNCTEAFNPSQLDVDGDGFGNFCDGDFDDSCQINFADLAYMKSVFFGNDPEADLNGDGTVNFLDLSRLKALFFGPPGPSALASCP